MNTRIEYIRKNAGLTQEQFADKIGLSRNYLWMLESGSRVPSDRTIKDICREFGVDETWLRTGEGEPFREPEVDAQLAAFLAEITDGDSEDFRKRFVSMLARLRPDQWFLLEDMAKNLIQKKDGQP